MDLAPPAAVVLPALAPSLWIRAVRARGLSPAIVDVDPETGLIDQAAIAEQVQQGARAILVPHTLGIIAELESVKAHGVQILEDVSQALGGSAGEIPCGGTADFCLISLDPDNIITCGAGALVLGKSKQAAAAIRKLVEGSPLHSPIPDMNAALGISQIAALDRFVHARREIANVFLQSLQKSRHKSLVQKFDAENVLSSFPVALTAGMKEVRQYALKRNVETIPAFAETIATQDEETASQWPNARSLALRCLLFPLYPMLARRDVETIAKVLSTLP
jgi:dTDP-4-amino-4,6-dideoxygalactose transaminase